VRSAIVPTAGVPEPFTTSAFGQYVRRYNEKAPSFHVVESRKVRVPWARPGAAARRLRQREETVPLVDVRGRRDCL